MTRVATYEIYQEGHPTGLGTQEIKSGNWRWRLRAANTKIVASGEGYTSKTDARRGYEAARRAFAEAVEVGSE